MNALQHRWGTQTWALYNKSVSIVQLRLMMQPGMKIILIVIQQTMPRQFMLFFHRKVLQKKILDAFKDTAQIKRNTFLHRKNSNIKKQMKTLLIWAPIALKRLAVLFFSLIDSKSDRLLLLKGSVWPKLSTDTLALTLWDSFWTSAQAGSWTEEMEKRGSEVIFWPLHPPWSSTSLAPCRQMHLRSSRDLPLEIHTRN